MPKFQNTKGKANAAALRADLRNQCWCVCDWDAELLVFASGRQEVVRVGVNAGVDSQANTLNGVLGTRGCCDALDLKFAIDDNRADSCANRTSDLSKRLVVSVQTDSCGWDASGERGSQFTTAGHVNVEP